MADMSGGEAISYTNEDYANAINNPTIMSILGLDKIPNTPAAPTHGAPPSWAGGRAPAYGAPPPPPWAGGQAPTHGAPPSWAGGQAPTHGAPPPWAGGRAPAYGAPPPPPWAGGQAPTHGAPPPWAGGQAPTHGAPPPWASGQAPTHGAPPPAWGGQAPTHGAPPAWPGAAPTLGSSSFFVEKSGEVYLVKKLYSVDSTPGPSAEKLITFLPVIVATFSPEQMNLITALHMIKVESVTEMIGGSAASYLKFPSTATRDVAFNYLVASRIVDPATIRQSKSEPMYIGVLAGSPLLELLRRGATRETVVSGTGKPSAKPPLG